MKYTKKYMVVPFQEEFETNKTYSKKLSDIISANEIPIDKKVKLYSQTKEKHKNIPFTEEIKENPEKVTENIIKQEDNVNNFDTNEYTIDAIIEKKVQEVLKNKSNSKKLKRINADKKITRKLDISSSKKGPSQGLRSKKNKKNILFDTPQISSNRELFDNIGKTPRRDQFKGKNLSLAWDAYAGQSE